MSKYNKRDSIAIRRKPDQSIVSNRSSLHLLIKKNESQFNLIALLPIYNAADWLHTTLAKLAENVDAIIALDDGSTDKSLDILRSCPTVVEIIVKPAKPLIDWNDAQNRYELYLAAEKFNPDWVVCMDADEYFDANFHLLRNDLANIPAETKALAFPFDDIDDNVIIREKFRHKMYRYKKRYTFDNKRLHCRLLPLEIAIDEVKLLNIRLFHIADPETRKIRFEKYLLTDPHLDYQSSYKHLLRRAIRKELGPAPENLIYTDVLEDGLQRKLKVRRITQFEKLFNDQTIMEKLTANIFAVSAEFKTASELYNRIILDSFLIRFAKKAGLVAEYSYDSTRDVHVSKMEAWLVEELHHQRNFTMTFAKFSLIKRCQLQFDCVESFIELINTLHRKKILRLK